MPQLQRHPYEFFRKRQEVRSVTTATCYASCHSSFPIIALNTVISLFNLGSVRGCLEHLENNARRISYKQQLRKNSVTSEII